MKRIFTFLASVLITATLWAQSPEKMSYQAVVRNSSDALVTNTNIGMQISILQGSASGTAVYVETQTPNTNANGLISIEIGAGTTTDDFSSIDWASGPYFIKTETDLEGGTNYTITGISQLLSVPYALHAKTAETVSGSITETDPVYTTDSSFIKTGTRSWNSSISKSITGTDTAYWNDKTYISDTDGDTKIETEHTADEDVVRMNVAGNEVFTADDTGFDFVLPTNDDNSNLKVSKSNGTVVFGVDGSGMMYGDGSGLSNVKSLANKAGGNSMTHITKNYGTYQNMKSVTIETPCSGKCFVMASGYARWESKGWDLYLASILRNADPNNSWNAENEFFQYLNIATDYNCADSSDQYASFAQHRCFNVGTGTQTFTLWANKYTTTSKVRMDDINLTVLFFPTAGTGSGILKSTQLEANDEPQDPNVPFTNIPRRPDGSELRKSLDAMIKPEKQIQKVPDDELIRLQKVVEELKTENETLRQEKYETDKRISDIENQIKLLLKTNQPN